MAEAPDGSASPGGLDGSCGDEPGEEDCDARSGAVRCSEACGRAAIDDGADAGSGAVGPTCPAEYTATRPSSTVTVVPFVLRYTSNCVPTARTVASPLLTMNGRFLSFATWKSA